MQLCSRLVMVFGQNFCENNKFGYLNPTLGKLAVVHDFGWWLVGKPMVDFLFALTEFSSLPIWFRSYKAKCVQPSCFSRGSTSLRSNFTWIGSSPINYSWHQKTTDTRLPGEDGIPLHCLVLTQYWSVTDRQTDGYGVAYTALAKLALWCAVKTTKHVFIFILTMAANETLQQRCSIVEA